MNVSEAIESRLEVREYADRQVDDATKRAILDAGRLAPSGKNSQHWQFLLVDDPADLDELAGHSPTGGWIADAAFAVVVLTDPAYPYHRFDAGRAVTHMQFAAWTDGVGSCVYTGIDPAGREWLEIPDEYEVAAIVGFGYPAGSGTGRKRRRPLDEVASRGRFGDPLDLES